MLRLCPKGWAGVNQAMGRMKGAQGRGDGMGQAGGKDRVSAEGDRGFCVLGAV